MTNMNWLIYHIASGHSFFTGVGLIVAAVLASTSQKSIVKRVASVAFLIGVVAVVISSAAIPYVLYVLAGIATIAWLILTKKKRWPRASRVVVVLSWLMAAAFEVPHHITPTPDAAKSRSVTIIGDSLTAGTGQELTWPKILAEEHELAVQD